MGYPNVSLPHRKLCSGSPVDCPVKIIKFYKKLCTISVHVIRLTIMFDNFSRRGILKANLPFSVSLATTFLFYLKVALAE